MEELETKIRKCYSGDRSYMVLCTIKGDIKYYCTLLLDIKDKDLCPCARDYINIAEDEGLDVPYLECDYKQDRDEPPFIGWN